ncbi:MAG: hypothetical protein HZB38_08875 [Planctomycetes bacterium]|nr:hypothetical protein [Planctomycetota bacterium]
MTDVQQELMTPNEAAKWFRRSVSWLRRQPRLLRLRGPNGQPLFHIGVCRSYVLGQLAGASGPELRRLQISALARACGLSQDQAVAAMLEPRPKERPATEAVQPAC